MIIGGDDHDVIFLPKGLIEFLICRDLLALGNLGRGAGFFGGLRRHGVNGVAVHVCRNKRIPLRSRGGRNIIVVARSHGHGAVGLEGDGGVGQVDHAGLADNQLAVDHDFIVGRGDQRTADGDGGTLCDYGGQGGAHDHHVRLRPFWDRDFAV